MLEHDTETTLTMLEKKAAVLRGKVMKAGWAAIAEHSRHNVKVMAAPLAGATVETEVEP